jgi:hypothetical protein
MPGYDPDRQLSEFESADFAQLRALQREVLIQAHAHSDARDLAIQMPTGSGKTLVALLMAAEAMRVSGSAVYLAGTIHLSNQVTDEAARLGLQADAISAPLDAVEGRRIRSVESGRTLAVMNYWAYFSERQLFAPPHLLIVDDAHLLESALLGRYAVDIGFRDHPQLCEAIFQTISERAPGYAVVDDVVANAQQPSQLTQLITFAHVSEFVQPVRRLLDEHTPGTSLRWSYQRIRDQLAQCLWLVGQHGIQVRPLRFPLHSEERFALALRRIYLSATISDLADLRRRLGTDLIEQVDIGDEGTTGTGRRFFVMADNPADAAELRDERETWRANTPRRVWFCRSLHQAHDLEDDFAGGAADVMVLSRLGEEMDQFEQSDNADLIVAGRYDGIDFADDTARLAVFPSSPFGADPLDDFMTSNFGRASYLNARIAERLTQALGRMTRGADDWAVVVLEDASLTHALVRREVSMYLPDGLWSEIEDGLDRLDGGFEQVVQSATAILAGEAEAPVSTLRERTLGERPEWSRELADYEARFGDALLSGTFDSAIPAATALLDRLGDHPLRAWWLYLRAMAEFLSARQDRDAARLVSAISDAQAAIRAAGRTPWLARVEASLAVMRRQGERRTDATSNPIAEFANGFRSTAALARWKTETAAGIRSDRHDDFTAAWTQIGIAFGFSATQPEGAAATDSLWRLGQSSFVFEAKVEHGPQAELTRRDVNQLLGQMEQEGLTGNIVHGAFLTGLARYHAVAEPVANRITVVPRNVAELIWLRLERQLDRCFEAAAAGHDSSAFQPPSNWLGDLLERAIGGFVTADDLAAVWPE